MRVAVLSDIHSNLAALEAVLKHAEAHRPIDEIWCLGDIVGYGPQPNEVIERLHSYALRAVVGNHDLAAIGQISTADFNPDAATAALWTASQLTERSRERLAALPQVTVEAEFTMVHGTLRYPIWEYLFSYDAALAHLARQQTPFGLVGHTHVPMLVVEDGGAPQGCRLVYLESGTSLALAEHEPRLVINPGGVGQPRDGDPRAAYAVYDSDARVLTLHRVEYDILSTQRRMTEAGLPRWLIERLSYGR